MSIKTIAVDPQHPENFIEIQLTLPTPGPQDLLVAVKAVSVNPVDTKVHASLRKNGLQQPRILGWDASGIVVAVGGNVAKFSVGDEVWYAGDITRAGSNATHQLVDARIAALKPKSFDWAQAAAIPLTAITAWEGLFEHLKIQDASQKETLLIIGGAGGVGSLAISLAKLRSEVNVIATASNANSASWCLQRGANLTVDYRHLKAQLRDKNIKEVSHIFCLNNIDDHWPAINELIAPLGKICTIVENQHPLDQNQLKMKSASLHWEFMFTRSMFNTPDLAQQGGILEQIAQLVDEGKLQGTLTETLSGLTTKNLKAAHQKISDGHMQGKLVITH